MQTLGLSDEPKRTDGWLKSIFWPTVENAWDVDYLGQQGFWLCFAIAVVTIVFTLLSGNLFYIGFGFLGALIYWTGGMGVREKSWIAAAMISACFLLDTLGAMLQMGIGVVVIRVLMLSVLLSNIRATFLASEWKDAGEDRPARFNESLKDKLVDVWPPKLWKMLQIPFYAFAGLWLVVNGLGLVALVGARLGHLHK